MKKNETNHINEFHVPKTEPLTPQYKKMDIKTNFKTLNDIWNNKLVSEKSKEN